MFKVVVYIISLNVLVLNAFSQSDSLNFSDVELAYDEADHALAHRLIDSILATGRYEEDRKMLLLTFNLKAHALVLNGDTNEAKKWYGKVLQAEHEGNPATRAYNDEINAKHQASFNLAQLFLADREPDMALAYLTMAFNHFPYYSSTPSDEVLRNFELRRAQFQAYYQKKEPAKAIDAVTPYLMESPVYNCDLVNQDIAHMLCDLYETPQLKGHLKACSESIDDMCWVSLFGNFPTDIANLLPPSERDTITDCKAAFHRSPLYQTIHSKCLGE